MKFVSVLIGSLFLFMSCAQEPYQGAYCARVDYINESTGTQSTYNLTIDIDNNKLKKMNFPNGGYLDDELKNADIADGDADVVMGEKKYHITILTTGNDCLNDVPAAVQCKGITQKGARCKNQTDNSNGLCRLHADQ